MKFLFLSFKRNILPTLLVFFTICLVIFSSSNLSATKNGLKLWATCVVPALFPFFIITNLLSHTKVVSIIGKVLDKFMRPIFNVPGIGGFAFVMGLISGYPVGAKIVAQFRENGLVTQGEGERLLAFTNNSGPLFILSSVGIALFGDTKTGLLLLATHVLACITVGIILARFPTKKTLNPYKNSNNLVSELFSNCSIKSNELNNSTKANISNSMMQNITLKNLGEVLSTSINNSISTILLIGGFVVIFSVIISILNQTNILDKLSTFLYPILNLLNIDLEFAKPLLSGILELTNGINLVANIPSKLISQNIVLSAFLLGFGGFSVLLQVYSIVSKTDLSMKKYLVGKFLQGIIAGIYTFLALKFLPFLNLDVVQTSSLLDGSPNLNNAFNGIYSFLYSFGIFVIAIALVICIFKVFNNIYKHIKEF